MTTSEPETAKPQRGRLGLIVIGVVCAAAAGGFGIVSANVGQTPGIAAQTVTFDVVSDTSVELNYRVAKRKGAEVHCTIDAFDDRLNILAARRIIVPAGTSRITGNATLPTPRRATGARIRDCRDA
ncbi:DUF4307 domain-containing protein [Spirillospora albida]|uniref:DUF4307 domain-containing protein n=1 Tax=Spirillospora albida TaxID=58123 RepID=UPI000689E917|nr:DUF4307 domain-containing protein [Spirillospora albida]